MTATQDMLLPILTGIVEEARDAWEGTWALWNEVAGHDPQRGRLPAKADAARPSAFALREHLATLLPGPVWVVCHMPAKQRGRAGQPTEPPVSFPGFWVEGSARTKPAGDRVVVDPMPRRGQPVGLVLPVRPRNARSYAVRLPNFPGDAGRVAMLLDVLQRRRAARGARR